MAFRSEVPDFSKNLTIIINEEDAQTTATFTVPEGVLTEYSKFFKAACRDASGKAATVIKLTQVDPETFRAYLFWIHGRKIAFNTNFAQQGVSAADLYPTSLALAKLWLLADRLTTTKLRNDVMEAMSRLLLSVDHNQGNPTDIFPPSMTVLIWPASTPGRSLRKLIVDYFAKVPIPQIEERVAEHHPDFVQELLQKIVETHESTHSNVPATPSNCVPPPEGAAPSPPQPSQAMPQPSGLSATAIGVNVILEDKLGKILHAKGARFATPKRFVDAILPKLQGQTAGSEQSQQTSVAVVMQFPDSTSQPIDRSAWSESFEKIVNQSGRYFGRGAFAFEFKGGSFPEDMGHEGILNHQILAKPKY